MKKQRRTIKQKCTNSTSIGHGGSLVCGDIGQDHKVYICEECLTRQKDGLMDALMLIAEIHKNEKGETLKIATLALKKYK